MQNRTESYRRESHARASSRATGASEQSSETHVAAEWQQLTCSRALAARAAEAAQHPRQR